MKIFTEEVPALNRIFL